MRATHALSLATLAAIPILACSQDGPATPLAVGSSLEPAGRPTSTGFGGGGCDTDFGLSPTAIGYEATMNGGCRLGGLGRGSVRADLSVDLSSGDPADQPLTATFVLVVRGDEIHITGNGAGSTIAPDGRVDFLGQGTITGGTGRYAQATGTIQFNGNGNLNSQTGTLRIWSE